MTYLASFAPEWKFCFFVGGFSSENCQLLQIIGDYKGSIRKFNVLVKEQQYTQGAIIECVLCGPNPVIKAVCIFQDLFAGKMVILAAVCDQGSNHRTL